MVSDDHGGSVWLKAALLAVSIAGPVWAGDAANGRKIVEDRTVSACLLCHSGPFPAPHLQGTIGPSLDGVGSRLTQDEIRAHLVDPARFNPDTVMPAYAKTEGLNRVGAAWRGRPILTPEQIDDVVAFLSMLRAP
jgi:sulfur-oxidizing protein SoxX